MWDGIAAAGETPRILSASFRLKRFERSGAAQWEEHDMGRIGRRETYGCSVALGGSSGAAGALLALAGVLLVKRRRDCVA